MPNFKAKAINLPNLPHYNKNLAFYWQAYKNNSSLLFCRYLDEKFFLQIIKEKDFYIIKADKLTRPIKTAALQIAMLELASFCEGVMDKNIALKKTALLQPLPCVVKDFDQLLEKIAGKKELFIEIGFGSGRHIIYQANEHPKNTILGFELFTPAILQVAKLARQRSNIILSKQDIRAVICLLKPNIAKKIFLHFPIPWEKKPQKRVLSKDFLKELARVLKMKGYFELRTDSKEYADFALELFKNDENFSLRFFKNKKAKISSKYEDRWKRLKKDIYELKAIKIKEPLSKPLLFKKFKNTYFDSLKIASFIANFGPLKLIFDDFFLHLEELFIVDKNTIILRLSMGCFSCPYHGYYRLHIKNSGFFINQPLKTKQNLKANALLMKSLKYLEKKIKMDDKNGRSK